MQLYISAGKGKTLTLLLNPTILSNYTWPAWLCSQSTCESIHLFQSNPPLGTRWAGPFPRVVQISTLPPLHFPNQERLIARFTSPGYHPGLHSASAASALSSLLPVPPHHRRASMALWKQSEHRHCIRDNWFDPEIMNIQALLWKLWVFQFKIRMKLFHIPLMK